MTMAEKKEKSLAKYALIVELTEGEKQVSMQDAFKNIRKPNDIIT